MSFKMFGIDLGTSTIKIYEKNSGIILDEYNVIAVEGNKVRAIGNKAYDMLEKNPPSITVTYPVKKGVIADVENMTALIKGFMKEINGKNRISTSGFIIATPTDITEVERRSFFELISSSNLRNNKISVVEKPIADALGLGLDISLAEGIMVVNIGADTTEISVMSLGGIVISKLVPVGGNKLDQAIKNIVKKNYNLYIGDKTAEYLKRNLATAIKTSDEYLKVFGRDVVTGLPKQMEIASQCIYNAISEDLFVIIDSLKMILERTPPEISSDILNKGIYLAGGSSQINKLDKLIAKELELDVNVSDDPTNTVAKGLGEIMKNEKYKSLGSGLKEIIFN